MFDKCATIILLGTLLMTCNLSKAEKVKQDSAIPSTTPTPDPRFRSAAGDPELRKARENGTYSSALQRLVEVDSLIYVGRSTIGIPDFSSLQNKLSRETIDDLITVNATSTPLPNAFDVYSNVKLVDVTQPTQWLEKTGKGRSSDGLLLMSKVGLNETGTEAVIYVEHYRPNGKVDKGFCVVVRDPLEGVDIRWIPADSPKS